jgi:hypothetical protein
MSTPNDYFADGENPSPKARAFVEELSALCKKHGVVLSTSDYDGLQVWDRTPEDKEPIYAAGIQDMTAGRTERRGVISAPLPTGAALVVAEMFGRKDQKTSP